MGRKFKLNILEFGIRPEDRTNILIKYKHLDDLKVKAKTLSKEKQQDLIDLLKKEIVSVRDQLNNQYAHKFFKVLLMLGPHREEEFFPYYPLKEDVELIKNRLVERLAKGRKERKMFNRIHRNFNGIEYDLIGNRTDRPIVENGTWAIPTMNILKDPKKKVDVTILPNLKGGGCVFATAGTVLKLMTSEQYANRIRKAKKPYDKYNYVGVEIELICKMNREALQKQFIEAKLANNVYIKDDSSIQREKEGEHTHEVTIMGKQIFIKEIIKRVCDVLNSKSVDSYVNNSCGVHVHIDMRNRDYPKCFNNFVQALPILSGMVPYERAHNRYCVINTSVDVNSGNGERRFAINPQSYHQHKTLEVRLHSGSTNALKLCNWVEILCAIADKDALVPHQLLTVEAMSKMFGLRSEVTEYITRRIKKFKDNTTISTKDDHVDQSA